MLGMHIEKTALIVIIAFLLMSFVRFRLLGELNKLTIRDFLDIFFYPGNIFTVGWEYIVFHVIALVILGLWFVLFVALAICIYEGKIHIFWLS